MGAAAVRGRMEEVLKLCQLTHVADRVIGELSHGYRKRCGIALAIIHKPKLVILDEPISGLDPKQIVEMRQVIRDLAKTCTVLISSHILAEISETCDRILVLNGGRIVAAGTEEDLARSATAGGTRLTLVVRGDRAVVEKAVRGIASVRSFDAMAEGQNLLRVHVGLADDQREGLVSALVAAGVGVRRLQEDESELETMFLALTKEAVA